MSSRILIIGLGTVLAMAAALVPASRGAPILPSSQLEGQVRSLAGIARLRVVAKPVSTDIAALDVAARELVRDLRARLRRAGLEVVIESDQTEPRSTVPRLTLEIIGVHDQRFPEAVAFSVNLLLEQPARIERLDEVMSVPTYVRHATALAPKQEALETVRVIANNLVDQFLTWSRVATGVK